MSFILDALKKSESDRQQKASPGISGVPTATRAQRTPRWLPALAVLLVINLAAVLYVALRPAPPSAAVPTANTPAAGVPRRPAASVTDERSTTDSSPRRQEPATAIAAEPVRTPVGNDDLSPSPTIAREDTRSVSTRAREAGFDTVSSAGSVAQEIAPTPIEEESWLTLNDLRASGRLDLPEMHIDLHVFSANPSERFVFINMNQYREKATLSEGPLVQQITTEGVLLNYRGTTFLLPRD